MELNMAVPLHTDFITCSSTASLLHNQYFKAFAARPSIKRTGPTRTPGPAVFGIKLHWEVSLRKQGLRFTHCIPLTVGAE